MSGKINIGKGDALIIVDVQNDFLPGGALPVPDGDAVIPVLNEYIHAFRAANLPIVATRDWHPRNHCSFKEQGGPWPAHCVAGSPGAEFAENLKLPEDTIVVSKATQPDREAYSGFQGTELHKKLRAMGVQRLFVGGLATDYCVLNTVKDALGLGYRVFLLIDAVKAVNVHPQDGENAVNEMARKGAEIVRLDQLA